MSGALAHRIKLVDALRTFSIVAVLANHYFALSFWSPPLVPGSIEESVYKALYRFAYGGAYGVSIFFVLSGYLITRMTAKRNENLYDVNCKQFYIRRAARILPLLCLVIAIDLMVVAMVNVVTYKPDPKSVIDVVFHPVLSNFDLYFFLALLGFSFNWFLIFSGRDYGYQLGILWSIAVEEQFYLFFPLGLRAAVTEKRLLAVLGTLIAIGPMGRFIGNFYSPNPYAASFNNSFASFDLIAMGVLLCLVERKWTTRISAAKFLAPTLTVLGAVLLLGIYFNTLTGNPVERVFCPSLLGAGVFMFLLGGLHLRLNPFAQKWLVPWGAAVSWPGQLSYGMYLYHPLVLFALFPYLLHRGMVEGFAIYVAVTVAAGYVSFVAFEQLASRVILRKALK